jgi:hypothetical protein
MSEILMKCGHTANAKDADGQPVCAICTGTNPDANVIEPVKPELKGRKARCTMCGRERGSRFDLPFFNYRDLLDRDTYYCGCRGWN